MGLLSGRVAVITGGTRGLGYAIACAYAEAGASVVVGSRSADSVDKAIERLRQMGPAASGIPVDMADLSQARQLADHTLETFGHFDVWVNNAGVSSAYGPSIDIPPKNFLRTLNTNILGVYHGSAVAMQHFLSRGRGKLINLLGVGARGPVPLQNAYASSKAWVRSFTLALAREYRDSGVGVFAFQPGMVHTELLTNLEVVEGYEPRLKVFPTIIRLLANPPELAARKALWLASPATDGRTGLEVRAAGSLGMLRGVLREIGRRILRRPAPEVMLQIKSIPSALNPTRRQGDPG
jgi:glucose 1-dehydrogenase